jgi:hypothetical protein
LATVPYSSLASTRSLPGGKFATSTLARLGMAFTKIVLSPACQFNGLSTKEGILITILKDSSTLRLGRLRCQAKGKTIRSVNLQFIRVDKAEEGIYFVEFLQEGLLRRQHRRM